MDPNIDVKKRKPRRTQGTPSFVYRNYFASGCIVVGIVAFAIFSQTSIFRFASARLYNELCTETEEERSRRYFFSMPAARRAETIRKALEERDEFYSER